VFFFEKKNQKTFITCSRSFASVNKSFLLLFFKKEDLSFLAFSYASHN